MDLFREKHTPQTEHGPSQKVRAALKYGMVSFYGLGNFQPFQGRGGDFQELGRYSLFGLWLTSELSWHWWVCLLACWCIKMSVYWGSRSSGSQLVCHLGPIWLKSVYVLSSVYVPSFQVCALPPSFLLQNFSKKKISDWISESVL